MLRLAVQASRHPATYPYRRASPQSIRTLIAPPTANSGPLMYRRSDRALPDITTASRHWLKTIPLFVVVVGGSTLAIFNYQKSSSSVVNSTLYALRTSPRAREILGDEVYFRDKFPWIWGELNLLHGRVDIEFGVKGTARKGMMRFRSIRKTRMSYVCDVCCFCFSPFTCYLLLIRSVILVCADIVDRFSLRHKNGV